MKAIVNIIIQFIWIFLCILIGYLISRYAMPDASKLLRLIIGGAATVIVYVILLLISCVVRAFRDPDIKIASRLGIPISRYNDYKFWYDRHQELMVRYGIGSKEEETFFNEFIVKVKNKNEWRRYQDYRFEETMSENRKLYKNL